MVHPRRCAQQQSALQPPSVETDCAGTIAEPGDTIIRMGDPGRMLQLRRLLAVPQFAYNWDAILLSGEGNDLIDSAPHLLNKIDAAASDPADYVDAAALQQLVADVRGAYAAIVAVRDADTSQSKGKPIYVHTYDYPTPRDSPARFLGAGVLGPWLYPAFLLEDIPEAMWIAVSDYLLNQLWQRRSWPWTPSPGLGLCPACSSWTLATR